MPLFGKPKPPVRAVASPEPSDDGLAPLDESVAIWPGRHVQVGRHRLHVRTTPGAGTEPALFVHGLGGSSHNWTDFAGVLRDRLAIESIDLPGHGRSGPGESYRLQAHADVVIAYLEHSGRGPVHLVGNSMGGAISVLVAAQRPDLVRTLTLISPAVPDNRLRAFPLKSDPLSAVLIVRGLGERLVQRYLRTVPVEVRVDRTLKLCLADPARYPQARREEAIAETKVRDEFAWNARAVLASMRGLAGAQFLHRKVGWTTLGSIAAPTLVVWGDTDRLVAPDLAPHVAAAIPDSRLQVFDRMGHTAMMEDPVATSRAFLVLLAAAADVR